MQGALLTWGRAVVMGQFPSSSPTGFVNADVSMMSVSLFALLNRRSSQSHLLHGLVYGLS